MLSNKPRFIIFGQSRSGSTLLKELLNSHPEIQCDGELLNPDEHYASRQWMYKIFRRYPEPLIAYRNLSSKNRVYGFTLFVYHLKNIEAQIQTRSKNGWQVIHIHRKNVINQSFSNLIATQTKIWHRTAEDASPTQKLRVDPEKLLRVVQTRLQWNARESEILKNIPHIQVVYEEDLMNNSSWKQSLSKVFSFLNVGEHKPESRLKKTDPRKLSEVVENYDEILQHLCKNNYTNLVEEHHQLSKKYS